MTATKTLRTCPKGHQYYKSSDCPTCPLCEAEAKPDDGFLSQFTAPVRRALQALKIDSPEKLSKHTEKEIMSQHGIGPSSRPKFLKALADKGLAFRE